MQFRELGSRGVTWEYHKIKNGATLYDWYGLIIITCWRRNIDGVSNNSHDYNPELGDIPNLLSFEEKYPEDFKVCEAGFVKYMQYVEDMQQGTAIEEEPKRRPSKTMIDLPTDDDGYPILPNASSEPSKDILEYRKRLIRSFVTAHYSE